MRARLLTAAIGIPLLLVAAVAGGIWWLLLVGVVAWLGLAEWYGLIRKYMHMSVPLDALFGGGLLMLIVAYNAAGDGIVAMSDFGPGFGGEFDPGFDADFGVGANPTVGFSTPPEAGAAVDAIDAVDSADAVDSEAIGAAGAFATASRFGTVPGFGPAAVLFPLVVYTIAREALSGRRKPIATTGAVVLGVVYVAGLLAHLLLLRGLVPDGLVLTLLAIGGTWLTDTGAFFVGRVLGGRRLVPALSPHKTVSGAIGGWVVGFLGLLAGGVLLAAIPLPRALLLAAAVPVAAQMGDLLESAMKREAGLKDTGRLLPGHGGILDRFDSLLLVAPTVYYISVLL